MEKVKAAIVGLGRIASLLEEDLKREKPCTHAGAIASNPDCILAGGFDINEERRMLFAERWKVPVYTDAAEMIRAQNPQILVIATHPDSHYNYCRLGIDLGVPVLICEKPLADTLSAARKIAALDDTRSSGPVIITNHERRYSADYIKVREILTQKKLGSLLSVRSVLYMGKNKRLLDVLWHDGTHLADVIMFLTGSALKHRRRWGAKLSAVKGTAWLEGELKPALRGKQAPGTEQGSDTTAAIPVVMEVGAGRDHLVFEMEFSCAEGRLRIGNGVFEIWESAESPYAEKFRSLKQTCESFSGNTGYFANMIADAVSCARNPGMKPVSSAADGLKVIEYLHSVKPWR
jgi:predicted dehydrogenase